MYEERMSISCKTTHSSSEQLLFTIKEEPYRDERLQEIDKGFEQHALETTGAMQEFHRCILAAYNGKTFLGSLALHLLWGSIQIRYFFIKPQYRRKGLGKALMTAALQYGKDHNCHIAFVDTMSYQALPFYKKLGFTLEFSRGGFHHGFEQHFLKKDLL